MNSPWIYLSEAYRLVEAVEGSSAAEKLGEALRRGEIRARAETWYSISGMSLDARGEEQALVEIPVEFWVDAFVMWDEEPLSSFANAARKRPTMGSRIPGTQLDHSRWYDASGIHFWREDILRLWPGAEQRSPVREVIASHEAKAPTTGARRPGPLPATRQRVIAEMRKFPVAELQTMKGEAMAKLFGASRGTCAAALSEILSELDPPNSDKL